MASSVRRFIRRHWVSLQIVFIMAGLFAGIALFYWIYTSILNRPGDEALSDPITEGEGIDDAGASVEESLTRYDETTVTLTRLIERAAAAAGGRSELETIQTVRKVGTLLQTISEPGQPEPMKQTVEVSYLQKRPNLFRINLGVDRATVRIAYNGTDVWRQQVINGEPRPAILLAGDEARDAILQADLVLPMELILGRPDNLRLLPPEDINGVPHFVVDYTGTEHPRQRLYFDQERYLLRRRVLDRQDQGKPTLIVDYSDFRRVGKAVLPFREVAFLDDATRTWDLQIEAVNINPGVLMTYFNPPSGATRPETATP